MDFDKKRLFQDWAGRAVDMVLVVGVGQAGGPAVATVPVVGGDPAALEDPVASEGVAVADGGTAGDLAMEDPVVLAGVVAVGGAAAALEAARTVAAVDGTLVWEDLAAAGSLRDGKSIDSSPTQKCNVAMDNVVLARV